MRGAKVAENPALFGLVLVVSACAPAHRVSPWGEKPPQLGALLRAPDLAARLAEIDAETAHLGLARTIEIEAKLPAARGVAVVRGYEGADLVGRRVTAVRAASARGVILALGPIDARDAARDQATEIVPALVVGDDGDPKRGAWRSGTDLDGDGLPDVVARTEQGAIEVWSLDVFGANRYPVELHAPPTAAIDADGDGRPDLVGRVPVPAGDPIAPALDDVATAAPGGFSHATDAARAWHAARARDLATPPKAPPGHADAKEAKAAAGRPDPEDKRLAREIVRAWHRALAGEPRDDVLGPLDKQRPSPALRASFDAWRRRVEHVARPAEPGAPPRAP